MEVWCVATLHCDKITQKPFSSFNDAFDYLINVIRSMYCGFEAVDMIITMNTEIIHKAWRMNKDWAFLLLSVNENEIGTFETEAFCWKEFSKIDRLIKFDSDNQQE